MKSIFTAKIRKLSTESKGITIPQAISDLWENKTKVKITMETFEQ